MNTEKKVLMNGKLVFKLTGKYIDIFEMPTLKFFMSNYFFCLKIIFCIINLK